MRIFLSRYMACECYLALLITLCFSLPLWSQSSQSSSSASASASLLTPQEREPSVYDKVRLKHNKNSQDYYIAYRFIEEIGQGWGWVRKRNDPWEKATWVAIKEKPGFIVIPGRAAGDSLADHGKFYKFWGKISKTRAYDPKTDEMLSVFELEGFENYRTKETPPYLAPGPADRPKLPPGYYRRTKPQSLF